MQRVQSWMKRAGDLGADVCLVHQQENIQYISGYTGSGWLAFNRERRYLFTDSRYNEQAAEQAPSFEVICLQASEPDKAWELIRSLGSHIGFEDGIISVSSFNSMKEKLPQAEWIGLGGLGTQIRCVKDAGELECIRKAAKATDDAFHHVLTQIQAGMTEMDVVVELQYYLAKKHGMLPAFPFIVASGANGSKPHAEPGARVIKSGDMITLDFGAKYEGYCSDMTRTFALGEPAAELRSIYAIVKDAQRLAEESVKPGLLGKEVDAIARKHITDHGYGSNFGHGTGHGVGLQIHESPGVGMSGQQALEPGMVITVEPGIYLPGLGGVRIEDTCIVTEQGYENVFVATKELIII